MPFQQRTNTSWRSIRSQPAGSRRLFWCLGAHLLRSPSIVKAFPTVPARSFARDGQNPPVRSLRSSAPFSVWLSLTSSRRRSVIAHRSSPFVAVVHGGFHGNKKPCSHGASRVQKSLFDGLPAHLRLIPAGFGALPTIRPGMPQAKRTAGIQPAMMRRLRDRRRRPNRG
jgi:hypothetical protein